MNVRTLGACGAMVLVAASVADWQLSRLETSHATTWGKPVGGETGFIPPAVGNRARAIKSKLLEKYRSFRLRRDGRVTVGGQVPDRGRVIYSPPGSLIPGGVPYPMKTALLPSRGSWKS